MFMYAHTVCIKQQKLSLCVCHLGANTLQEIIVLSFNNN